MNRRHFLHQVGSCGAYMLSIAAFDPIMTRRIFSAQDKAKVVASEKWGRLEKIHDGIWGLISLPFETRDFTTVCNGGIISGTKRTLVVEAFMQPKGAKWMCEQAQALTGRWPTDVVCTHFHADHTGGHAGFERDKKHPGIWLTESTHEAAKESLAARDGGNGDFKNVQKLAANQPTEIDLGGRVVKVHPRSGHTASDVTIEVVDPKVIFCGDLFFNRMFPNYGDAIPNLLSNYSKQMIATPDTVFVPGHGPIADAAALNSYNEFLAFVQDSATKAFKAGKPAVEAAKEFQLSDSLKDWMVWSPDNATKAYNAWFKVLRTESEKKLQKPAKTKLKNQESQKTGDGKNRS